MCVNSLLPIRVARNAVIFLVPIETITEHVRDVFLCFDTEKHTSTRDNTVYLFLNFKDNFDFWQL